MKPTTTQKRRHLKQEIDVMTVFRQHGITGNPGLRLDATADDNASLPAIEMAAGPLVVPSASTAE